MPAKRPIRRELKKRVYFKLDAPEARDVILCGSFNNWDAGSNPLKRDKRGVWRTWLMLKPGRYEYRFLVDGEWENDPGAEVVPNPYGAKNCLRTVT